jgi:hypothetical protein
MNLNPGEVLEPIFHFLADAIADYGVYLYLALVWPSATAIAWIFSGGLRRKMRQPPRISVGIVIHPSEPPSPPIIYHEPNIVCDDNED